MKKFTQDDVARALKQRTNVYLNILGPVMYHLSDVLADMLAQADEDDSVEIRLTNGIILTSKYVGERAMYDPRNLEPVTVQPKCLVGCKYTETFKEKVNNRNE